jgi:hypothetical protein
MTARHQREDPYQAARRRKLSRHPDPFARATSRYAERGFSHCDCPCHWWPNTGEAIACCPNRGMRWAGDGYLPWGGDEP